MLGHQISFLAFATARQALCTPPAESSPDPSDEAGLVAHPSVGGGECIRPLKFSWLVVVTFADGATRSFRWYRRSDASRCMRDFGTAEKGLFRCYGYFTWEGWRDVSSPLPV